MDRKNYLPHLTQNKWLRLSASLFLATILAGVILFIPLSRSKTIQLPGASSQTGRAVQVAIPLGAEIVRAADGLVISKSADPLNQVNHGDFITYTLTVQNFSAGPISQLFVTDTIPINTVCVDITDVPDGLNEWSGNDPQCTSQTLVRWLYLDQSPMPNPFDSGEAVVLRYVVQVG